MYYFLVYHDETHTQYLQKLLNSVQTFGKEFQIIIYPKSEIDPVFMDKHKNILSLPRGGGYWLWKPYMIDSILQLLNEGDVLFYLDAKYYFIENFFPWVNELLSLQDLVVFKNKPNEPVYLMKEWCKKIGFTYKTVLRKKTNIKDVCNADIDISNTVYLCFQKQARTRRV
jgi:hypothetical protein